MSTRQRMTWAALNRGAATPPAIPGYGTEDQDHPAHTQDDPGMDDYNIGGPSEFAEDVHPGPYRDSGPPALPGVGVEDQDHPAHRGQVGRNASLMELVRRKSAKALVLARATLGRTASWDNVEDQAYGYMSMDDSALDASIGRLSGDFLGMEDDLMGMFPDGDGDMDDMMPMDDDMMPMDDGMMDDDMMDDGMMDDDMSMMSSRLRAMEDELISMRAAVDQNDPDGETLGAHGKSEDEERDEEDATDKAAHAHPFIAMFDAYDTDKDGFVVADEWGGPQSVFASLDEDNDGIIARHEVLAGCEKLPEGKMRDNCEEKQDGAEKTAFGHLADFDDEELDMLQAMQYGDMDDDDDDVVGCGMRNAKDDDSEDDDSEDEDSEDEDSEDDDSKDDDSEDEGSEDDDSNKEASAEFFATGFDPMGLSDGTSLTAADKAAFRSVFGGDEEDDDSEDDDSEDEDSEDDDSDKEASLTAMLQPQRRTASRGVRSVGRVARAPGKRNEIQELSNLWDSKPDVSGSFS